MSKLAVWLASAAVFAPCAALAQPAPQKAPAAKSAPAKTPPAKAASAKPDAKGQEVETVVVTGESQGTRLSIDRRSYSVQNDLAATTGSVSDALRNVPSVEVDVQGNVSLRGDANVTIMIDGKPSNLFKGAAGAQALQALPADQIDRVEVITNPSAAYSPEGSAGIINLVTKKVRRIGKSASVRAQVGSAGRRNIGVNGAYNTNELTLTADGGYRRDPQHSTSLDQRITLDPSGQPQSSLRDFSLRGPLSLWNVRGGVDYDPDKETRISAELRHNEFKFDPDFLQHFTTTNAAGAETSHQEQSGTFRQDRNNTAGHASYRRKMGDDHEVYVSLSRERTDEKNGEEFTNVTLTPPAPDLFRAFVSTNELNLTQLKADYSRPMPAESKLKVGYDLKIDDNSYDNQAVRGTSPANAVPDASQTNLFLYKQTINAGYATYERPIGDFTFLAGLRVEDVKLDLNQVTTAQKISRDDARAYPTLHLAYKLSDKQQLTLNFSERVQRPQPQDLNPVRFVEIFSARQGNPFLKPQITHAYEAGWQYRGKGAFYLATAYYRKNDNGVTDVVTDIGNGVLLTSKQNLASSQSAGLELVANGKLVKALSYNVSANGYWTEIDASNLGVIGVQPQRSSFAVGGRASLNWTITPKDFFQVNVQANPKRLLPQGYQDPMVLMFMGYRHKFDDSLSGLVTVQDPFNMYRSKQVIDTPTLKEKIDSRGRIQAVFLGLTWNYGSYAKRRDPGFDFGATPAP